MDSRLISKANVSFFFFFPLEVDVFRFLTITNPTSVGIKALTYLDLVANI